MRTRLVSPFVAVIALASAAGATMVRPMSIEELTHAASRVVQAQVVQTWAAWNPEHTRIYTYSRLRVDRVLKGGAEPEIVVQQVGGSAGGYTMKISGVRPLQKGEQTILFLRPSPQGASTWSIVGLMQGHFQIYSVNGSPMVSNGIARREVKQQGATRSLAVPMPLQEFESHVREALAQ